MQNHRDNYGASRKPKNSTLMEQVFCQLRKILPLMDFRDFPQNKSFFCLCHFSIRKSKLYMKLHKNVISCFCESGFD